MGAYKMLQATEKRVARRVKEATPRQTEAKNLERKHRKETERQRPRNLPRKRNAAARIVFTAWEQIYLKYAIVQPITGSIVYTLLCIVYTN